MKEKIAFIGFGRFGKALVHVLRQKDQYEIAAFDLADSGDACQLPSAAEAMEGAAAVFFVVPSGAFRSCTEHLDVPNVPLVTCSKGIDPTSQKLPIEVLHELFPNHSAAALSGPMLSAELEEGLPSAGTVASLDAASAELVKTLFDGTTLSLETSSDEIGISWCGILKNVYALALGLSDGLELGDNFKSVLTRRAMIEMQQIIKAAGGDPGSMMSFAGIGDFLATGYSTKSRNYAYGFALGHGDDLPGALAEGVKNFENVVAILGSSGDDAAPGNHSGLPLLETIRSIFSQNAPPRESLLEFHQKNHTA